MNYSPIAHLLEGQEHTTTPRTAPVYGIAIHQTGESIVTQAIKHGADPLEWAAAYYLKPDSYFAHYVVGHTGEIIQLAGDHYKTPHVGFSSEDRQLFLSGHWANQLPPAVVDLWRSRWTGVPSPAHLFPGPSVNNVYVGVELLPLVQGINLPAVPWLVSGRFTQEQHHAVVALAADIAQRNNLPAKWHMTSRLCTHEELNPLQRTTKEGGWDPGWMRKNTSVWFDMEWVRLRLNEVAR